jgi:hypothetical protein
VNPFLLCQKIKEKNKHYKIRQGFIILARKNEAESLGKMVGILEIIKNNILLH